MATPRGIDALRRRLWRHPEWWCLGLSVAAWLVLLAHSDAASGGMAMSHGAGESAAMLVPSLTGGVSPWFMAASSWLGMVIAMMLPLEVRTVRGTATHSLWRRRHRAIGAFLTGYLLLWLLTGLGLLALLAAAEAAAPWPLPRLAGMAFGLAAAWELTPLKFHALRAGHRSMPLAPHGWRADRDCFCYGWMIGTHCLCSCWILMLACLLTGHRVDVMAITGIVGFMGRYPLRPDRHAIVSLYSKIIVLILLFGLAEIYALTAVTN
jgi:hypothetical protein